MMKRDRGSFDVDAEVFESFAALLRQSTARAVDRLRLQRANHVHQQQQREMGRGGAAQQQQTSAATVRPIDVLIIQYCMYYLDLSRLPASHYVRLAQEIVTSSSERILLPRYFAKVNSLPQLCESLVEENTAEVMQETLAEVEAFVEAREAIAEWISEEGTKEDDNDDDIATVTATTTSVKEDDKEGDYLANEEAESNASHRGDGDAVPIKPASVTDAAAEVTTDLAALLYRSTEYWVRVHTFIHALAEGSAHMNAYPLQPRYERELMGLLHTLTVSPHRAAAQATDDGDDTRHDGGAGASRTTRTVSAQHASPNPAASKTTSNLSETTPVVKQEDVDAMRDDSYAVRTTTAVIAPDTGAAAEDEDDAAVSGDEVMDDVVAEKQAVVTAVLGDVLALASCPSVAASSTATRESRADATNNNNASAASLFSAETLQSVRGVNTAFYTMIHARLAIMVARHRLHSFGRHAAGAAPALTRTQEQLLITEQRRQAELAQRRQPGGFGGVDGAAIGVPVDYVPDDRYYDEMLERQNDFIGEDEELYKDEVVDYYLRKSAAAAQQDTPAPRTSDGPRNRRGGPQGAMLNGQELVKPHRFCKVKTGFTWTQYNRTHYDSRTNPPPRMVMWYEFTLFYPALVHTRRDMRHIFHIEDTPRGPNDDYCLLVFSVGPPYADVAYRIVKKQWDTRRGGVRISFDATGKYKLFFRFASSNYRR